MTQTAEVIDLHVKRCTRCGVTKPLTDFNKSKRGKFGHVERCRVCTSVVGKEFHARHPGKKKIYRTREALRVASSVTLTDGTKVCTGCGEEKHITRFNVTAYVPGGRSNRCKDCCNESTRRWRDRPGNRERNNTRAKASNKLRAYGLSTEAIAALLASQGGGCAICRSELQIGTRNCHVDHDHATGANRGLLCSSCNTGIGLMRDNEEILLSAVRYLRRSRGLIA